MILNKVLLVISLFLSVHLNSNKCAKIIYEITLNKHPIEDIKKTSQASKNVSHLLEKAHPVDFVLSYSTNESIYRKKRAVENEFNKSINITEVFAGGQDEYYYDTSAKKILRSTDIGGNQFLIETNLFDWNLTKEKKKIGRFNCIKAVAVDENGDLTNIKAWFTSEIPVSFGPNRYNNLPGLIIMLQDDFVTYVAKKIELNHVNIKINKPTKGTKLTEKEFREKYKGFFDKI